MGQKFINGAQYAVSTTLGASTPITGISNADPAVASCTTPPTLGSIVLLSSAWPRIDGRAVRVGAVVAATSFVLEGIDAADVAKYPAGEGDGAFQLVGGFTPLTQIRNITVQGGDQNYNKFQYVEDPSSRERSSPTNKSAMTMEISLDYDPALAWYDALVAIDENVGVPTVLREVLPGGGGTFYYAGYMSFNKVGTKQTNDNVQVKATFAMNADPIRYAA